MGKWIRKRYMNPDKNHETEVNSLCKLVNCLQKEKAGIRILRENGNKWGIQEEQIAVIGFSAGIIWIAKGWGQRYGYRQCESLPKEE